MTRKTRRLTTWLVIATGSLVLVVAGFVAKDAIVESYWLWKLDSDNTENRKIAAERLGRLRSIRAIPKLIDNFRRDPAAIYSGGREKELSTGAKALINVGVPAVPTLVDALNHQDKEIRWGSGKVLSWIGPQAVPALLTMLTDQDEVARSEAARTFALMSFNELLDSEARSAVPALIEALEDDNTKVRSLSAWALSWISPPAKDAVPALTKLLKDGDRGVRVCAEQALRNIKSSKTRISQYFPDYQHVGTR